MKSARVSSPFIVSIIAFLFSGFACRPSGDRLTTLREQRISFPNPTISPMLNDTVDHFVTAGFEPLYDWERVALTRVWKKVPHHESYEIVRSVHGEVAGAYGLALIISDRSLAAGQSSLIVFIQHPHNKFDLYWILKNENLSRVSISRASGDIMVNGLREDGSRLDCEIAWNRKDNKWTCMGF
jgi:hypothetical protein